MHPVLLASPGSGMADAFFWLLGMGALGLFVLAVIAALTLGLVAFAVHKLGLIEYATGRGKQPPPDPR